MHADAVLVHHGYFWRGEDRTLRGIRHRRVALLMKHEISLLAYHLPLDAHPELGNNAQLGEKLHFLTIGHFGEQNIALHGQPMHDISLEELGEKISSTLAAQAADHWRSDQTNPPRRLVLGCCSKLFRRSHPVGCRCIHYRRNL